MGHDHQFKLIWSLVDRLQIKHATLLPMIASSKGPASTLMNAAIPMDEKKERGIAFAECQPQI